MTEMILPGTVLRPLCNSAAISVPCRVLYVHEVSDDIVLIPIEPRRSKKRLYFVGYTRTCLSEIRKQLDPEAPKLMFCKVRVRADAVASDEELDKKYLRTGQDKSVPRAERERRWRLIEPLVSSVDAPLLFDSQIRQAQIALRARQLTDSPKKLRRLQIEIRDLLSQYWAGGSIPGALTPYLGACGGRGKEKHQKRKLGRPNAPTRTGLKGQEGYVLSEHDKDILQYGWRNYYIRGTTVGKAYRKMCREFYSEYITDDAGHVDTRLLPATDRPSQPQFRHWGPKQSPDQAAWKIQLGKTNAARIVRAITKNATDGLYAVGQRAGVDSTTTDQHLVSTVCRLDRIGMAHRILVVDSLFRYIPGFYMGLQAPSATTVKLAFLHAMSPKADWLRFLGLDPKEAADWIPIAFASAIADNTDARAEQVFVSLDAIGTGQLYIPVARSDLNPAAEVSHHQMHRMADHNLHGTTHGRKTERKEARADDLARHTVIEAIRETARALHTHNTMPLDIQPTLEMRRELLDKGLPITRLNLTRMRIDQGRIARGLLDIDEARGHLMPIVRGTFTAKGVKLLRPDTGSKRTFMEGVLYVSTHPLMIARFMVAKNERGKRTIDYFDDDFRDDPYNPSSIFYRNLNDGELIKLDASSDDREALSECSYYDFLYNQKHYASYRHDVVEQRDQALSQMEGEQEHTKRTAQEEYDAALAAEPKPPSRTKLRSNKNRHRERELSLYQYGMPVQQPESKTADVPVSAVEPPVSTIESPVSGVESTVPVTAHNPPVGAPAGNVSGSGLSAKLSVFAKAVRSHLDRVQEDVTN